MVTKLVEELDWASHLARQAGRAVMTFYGSASAERAAGSPVTAADRLADRIIVSCLRERFPYDGILSEESKDSGDRLGAERVWIVDPLDGTREFIDGVPEFAVMIGLAIGGKAVLGVVYCPADHELYAAAAGMGSWLERGDCRRRLVAQPAPGPGLRLIGSRSHPDPRLQRIRRVLAIDDVLPSGSVGVKCGLIARGERDLYVHPVPYLKEWDTCAPEVVLREAGGTVCDCAGEPLRYNKPDPVQPRGIVAAAPGVLPVVMNTVRAAFYGGRVEASVPA
jgi:3'(2'), 5'-bisphosphate nucleotidase